MYIYAKKHCIFKKISENNLVFLFLQIFLMSAL